MGTERSKGTKVFSVTGKVKDTGLVEVPLGTPLRTIMETIAGGVPQGTIKAVQTGRTVQRLHFRGASGHPGRLRISAKPRLDHGLG
jgi:NADH:ubiquinone oxidoreductase subunit F (NADH-binding)